MVMIRDAIPADYRSIAEIHLAGELATALSTAREPYVRRLTVEAKMEIWKKALQDRGVNVLLAEEDGIPKGFCSFGGYRESSGTSNTIGEIHTLFILPQSWRQGLGGRLCQAALQRLHDFGYGSIRLWVYEDNIVARRFYERAGFSCTTTTKEVTNEGISSVGLLYERKS